MLNYEKYFEGKRVTKQGFGVLGRGYGVVRFLLESGVKEVIVTDTKEEENFKEQIAELKKFCEESGIDFGKITFKFGRHELEDFENADFVIAASGVAKDNIYLNHAKKNSVPVYQESSLFAEIIRDFNNQIIQSSEEKNILKNPEAIKVVGVTGTRGKTTTTFLIKHILENFLKTKTSPDPSFKKEGSDDSKVYFGGNVQGVATLENLKNLKAGDWVVMELDSWVLQGFGDIKFSPNVAVFTTFMSDHMNYYKGDMQDYFLDKANIFINQNEGDFLVTTKAVDMEIHKYLDVHAVGSRIVVNDEEVSFDAGIYKTNLLGKHNHSLVSLAIRTARILGIDEEVIKSSVESFKGVKGRLELVYHKDDVRIYNDTNATTGDATVAALRAVSGVLEQEKSGGKIIFITGGRDKELDMTKFLETIEELFEKGIFKKIIFLQDETTTGTNRVLQEKAENSGKYSFEFIKADSLEKAVEQANELVNKGDIVLFSPGFASFGMFKNEYDRGEIFDKGVERLFK